MSTAVKSRWMRWAEVPWLSRSEAGGGAIQLAERLLEAVSRRGQTGPFSESAAARNHHGILGPMVLGL